MGVVVTFYQSYIARKLPTEFSESYYLALSMGCLTETLTLGGPILFAATSSPTAFYLVLSLLVSTTSLAILLPIFVPKYLHRNARRANVLRSSTLHRRTQAPGQSLISEAASQKALPPGTMTLRRLNSGSGSGDNNRTERRGRVSFAPNSTGSWGGINLSGISGVSGLSGVSAASLRESTKRLTDIQEDHDAE